MTELELRAAICEMGRRMWRQGLIGGTEGNLSARLSARQVLCTPSGVGKGHMWPDDLCVVDLGGKLVRGPQPTCETPLHLAIYRARKDCQAVIHAHPPFATAFALAGEDIPDDLMPTSAAVLGSVALVPFAMPGTDEVPRAIEPLLADHKTFLLSNHGALVLGKDIEDAYHRMETLERIAHTILNARLLGGTRPLPNAAFDELQASVLNGDLG